LSDRCDVVRYTHFVALIHQQVLELVDLFLLTGVLRRGSGLKLELVILRLRQRRSKLTRLPSPIGAPAAA
jgi:hypothetical protein